MTSIDFALLLLRLLLVAAIAPHGWRKASRLEATADDFAMDGLGGGKTAAALAPIAQLVGSALLLVGALTPFAALALIGVMFVATTVKWSNGFWSFRNGYEYPALLTGLPIAVAVAGPGSISIDHVLGFELRGAVGIITSVIGLLIGASSAVILRRLGAQGEGSTR